MLKKGDIVLVNFPFTDLSQTKLRPAVVLWVNPRIDEITLCFISSQNINNLSYDEFLIEPGDPEFTKTGLRVASKVRVTRIVTLEGRLILRRLGELEGQKMQLLNSLLIQVFNLI